jgi:hypothetical protein
MASIAAILASGSERRALDLVLSVTTIALFLLNLSRAAEHAERLAERLQTSENTHAIQPQMLTAASRRPADRDALVERLRDGRF